MGKMVLEVGFALRHSKQSLLMSYLEIIKILILLSTLTFKMSENKII